MTETSTDVRRDIEVTRERMADTITKLERRFDVKEMVRNNPLPALAIAAGAGFLLSRSARGSNGGSTRATAHTATNGLVARASMGAVVNQVADRLFGGVADVLGQRVDGWVDDLRGVVVPRGQRAHGAASAGADRVGARGDARRVQHRKNHRSAFCRNGEGPLQAHSKSKRLHGHADWRDCRRARHEIGEACDRARENRRHF